MGSFAGHALPGTFFIFFGIWLAIRFSYQHFVSKYKRRSTSCCHCKCRWDIIEGSLKIGCSAFGFLMEQVTNGGPKFHLTNPAHAELYQMGNNWSHCTMYTFFIFAGLADIIVAKLPKASLYGLQHLMLSLALLIEGYLFYFHTHGRAPLDVRLHTLLILAIWSGALTLFLLSAIEGMQANDKSNENYKDPSSYALLESEDQIMKETSNLEEQDLELTYNSTSLTPDSTTLINAEAIVQAMEKRFQISNITGVEKKTTFPSLLKFSTVCSMILQGTWFWQVAFILYPPNGKPWDPASHTIIEFATLFFAWHLASIIVFVSVLCLLTYHFVRIKVNR
uniref:Transmembrane protein 45B-like n=1 Tax=Phallusia mammillata TaxID=59560 RepID=A0A6F9DVQ8_9ASCI|nr:transmembrane protein 45B-like [Phallusia mammillata]